MIEQLNRPNDARGFLHKRIARFAGGLVKTGLRFAGAANIPLVSTAARLGGSFLRGGSRSRQFTDARAVQRARAARNQASRFGRGGNALEQAVAARKFAAGVDGQLQLAGEGGECAKGFHVNKSGYHLKDGTFVPPMSRCVRNRRRNNDNGRAAMRAARRLLGRKKSQDAIDRALRAFAPARRRKAASAPTKGTTIVQN